jgi:chaperonin cofactor prefoldin
MERKPLRIFRSVITNRYYATRSYKDEGNGNVTITGSQDDVTDEVNKIVDGLKRDLTEARKQREAIRTDAREECEGYRAQIRELLSQRAKD